MRHSRMIQLIVLALLLALLPGLAACAPAPSVARTNTLAPAEPTAAAVVGPAPGEVQPPDQVPATVPTEDLIAQVKAGLPKEAYTGLRAMPLMVAQGAPPLWAVISTGRRNFELEPLPSHFLGIYALAGDAWQELARMDLNSDAGGPDYVEDERCQQVAIEPGRVWFEVQGGMGAHGGSFQLISFDGQALRLEASLQSPSPGMGRVRDLDGDGQMEVVLDQSDPYVFCYACGARDVHYQVLRWDAARGKLAEVSLQALAGLPESVSTPANRAVALARAGLWKDAYALIQQAKDVAGGGNATLNDDCALIKLHAEALVATLDIEYPLIQQVFYGDYAAAVDIMRQYRPEEIFTAESPLVTDPMVQPFVDSLSQHLVHSATNALEAEPELAAAYFVRGWGEYLADPASPQARADVAQAARLAPDDALYTGSATLLK
mgnify:CR=1 FL=1